MAGGNREPGRTVTSKVIAVLGAFEHTARPLGLTEIADRAGLPASTTHRLVAELTDGELLSRKPDGSYQLGLRIWELAQNTGRQLRDTVRPFVQELFALTGETAQLVVRDKNEALVIDRAYGPKKVPRSARVGGRMPLNSTAVGKVLLAFDEPWVKESYLKLDMHKATAKSIINPQFLDRQLKQIKTQGYAITIDEQRVGAASIAVPVWHTGRLGAAIALVIPSANAANMERYLQVLQATSERIQRATAHIPLDTLLASHRKQDLQG